MLLRCIKNSSISAYLNNDGGRTALYSTRAGFLYRPLAILGKDQSAAGCYKIFALVRADFGDSVPELSMIHIQDFETVDGAIDAGWEIWRLDNTHFHLGDMITQNIENLFDLIQQRDTSTMNEIIRKSNV